MNDLLISLAMVLGSTISVVAIVGTIGYVVGYPEWKEMKKRVKEEEHFPFMVGDIIIEKRLDNKKFNFWKIVKIVEKQDIGSSKAGKIIKLVNVEKDWKHKTFNYDCTPWGYDCDDQMYLEKWRKASDIEKFCLENNK